MHEIITGCGSGCACGIHGIGFAERGREAPPFVSTAGAKYAELARALAKLGDPAQVLIAYDALAVPLYARARAADRRCEVVVSSKIPRHSVRSGQEDRLRRVPLGYLGGATTY